MISDKELFIQMLERDVLSLYDNISKTQALLNIPAVQHSIFNYADKGIEYLTSLLFGKEGKAGIDEASEIAKFIATEKIEEYRNKIKEQNNYKNY